MRAAKRWFAGHALLSACGLPELQGAGWPLGDDFGGGASLLQRRHEGLSPRKQQRLSPSAGRAPEESHAAEGRSRGEVSFLLAALAPAAILALAALWDQAARSLRRRRLSPTAPSPGPSAGGAEEASPLDGLARRVMSHKRAVMLFWALATGVSAVGAARLVLVVSNTIEPPPGSTARAANLHFEAAFPGQTKAMESVYILKVAPPAKVLDVAGLREFSFQLREELNSTGKLTSFSSNATFWFESAVPARDLFVSADQTATIFEWTSTVAYDTVEAAALSRENQRIADRLARQLPGISFHGLVSLPDVLNLALADVMHLLTHNYCVIVPLAALALRWMLGSSRLLVIPCCTLATATATSFGAMYIWSFVVTINITTPALMTCIMVSLGMDYSLFLLTRFRDELQHLALDGSKAASVPDRIQDAITRTWQTAGGMVLTSATLLFAPLLALALFPVTIMSCLGVGASISVVSTALVNLTLTPAVIASFPHFFHAACVTEGVEGSQRDDVARRSVGAGGSSSFWTWIARMTTTGPINIFIALAALALAIAQLQSLRRMEVGGALEGSLPRNSETSDAFAQLQASFGMGTAVPIKVMLAPMGGGAVTSEAFWTGAQRVIEALVTDLHQTAPSTAVFPNFVEGLPVPWLVADRCTRRFVGVPSGSSGLPLCGYHDLLMKQFSNRDQTALWGYIRTDFDPLTSEGGARVRHMRHVAETLSRETQIQVAVVGVASDCEALVTRVFRLFPAVAAVTLAIVLVLCGFMFKSVLIPIWQCLTICMTMAFSYGLAVLVYQHNGLAWTGVPGLSGKDGIVPWICPVMAFPFVVGICLDYDVFLLSRVTELRAQSVPPVEAIRQGLCGTGGIITVAGMIMAFTFSSMLMSGMLLLNCGAFMMIAAVLFDTFFIRIAVVPAAMSIFGRHQWWPSELSAAQGSAASVLASAGRAEAARDGRLSGARLRARRHGAAAAPQQTPSPPLSPSAAPAGADDDFGAPGGQAAEVVHVLEGDLQFFEEASQAIMSQLIEQVAAVEGGDWGAPVSGTEADGFVYSRRVEGHPVTVFMGVLTLPDEKATLEQLQKALMPEAIARHLSNVAEPCTLRKILTLDAAAPVSLAVSECYRGCLGIELERLSLDIYRAFAPVPSATPQQRIAGLLVGTNSSFCAAALTQEAVPAGLAERIAQQEAVLAGADGVMLVNHLSGVVFTRTDTADAWRVSVVMQLDPSVPAFLPRWGIEYSQREMMQDVLKGVLREVA